MGTLLFRGKPLTRLVSIVVVASANNGIARRRSSDRIFPSVMVTDRRTVEPLSSKIEITINWSSQIVGFIWHNFWVSVTLKPALHTSMSNQCIMVSSVWVSKLSHLTTIVCWCQVKLKGWNKWLKMRRWHVEPKWQTDRRVISRHVTHYVLWWAIQCNAMTHWSELISECKFMPSIRRFAIAIKTH